MRRYAADQIDLDPFCCADCARAWYGTDARGHGSFIAYTQIPSGAPTRLRQEREAHAATRRAELSRAPIVETECAWCDVELPEELHGVRRFCSRECSRLWYNAYYDRRRAAA